MKVSSKTKAKIAAAVKKSWLKRRAKKSSKLKNAGQTELKFSAPAEPIHIPESVSQTYPSTPDASVCKFAPDDIVVVRPTGRFATLCHLVDHVAKVIQQHTDYMTDVIQQEDDRVMVQFITTPPGALCAGMVAEIPGTELQPLISFTNEGVNNKGALQNIIKLLSQSKPSIAQQIVDAASGGAIPVEQTEHWIKGNHTMGVTKINDPVNHPKHYTSSPSGIECIEVTRHLNFNIGNVVKYLWRTDHKNGLEDLKKAQWYLNDEIKRVERLHNTTEKA